MPDCHKCGKEMSRRHRSAVRKVLSRASFRCSHCGARAHFYRPFFALFQPWCQCPLCHNRRLKKLGTKDKIERRSRNPLRRLLRVLGFPIYYCTFCRYQFRDWRRLDPDSGELAPSATAAEGTSTQDDFEG